MEVILVRKSRSEQRYYKQRHEGWVHATFLHASAEMREGSVCMGR